MKEGSCPGAAALRALPHPHPTPGICELSAELSSRTPCTFTVRRSGSSADRHDCPILLCLFNGTDFLSLLLQFTRSERTFHEPPGTHFCRLILCSGGEKLTSFPGTGNFPPESSCCVHRQNQLLRPLLTSLAPGRKETPYTLCKQVLTFAAVTVLRPPSPFPFYQKLLQTPAK